MSIRESVVRVVLLRGGNKEKPERRKEILFFLRAFLICPLRVGPEESAEGLMACTLLIVGTQEEATMMTPYKSTLLDLVQTINDYATSDDEVVATVSYLVNSGKVLLCGNFAGARIDLSVTTGSPYKETLVTGVGL
jgi:hypothetical protein